jgi:hypothetical protein
MRSEVFADSHYLLGRGLVEGDSLGPVVALQLCLVVLFVGWAGGRGDLALGHEAVHVSLTGHEVPLYVARSLLIPGEASGTSSWSTSKGTTQTPMPWPNSRSASSWKRRLCGSITANF